MGTRTHTVFFTEESLNPIRKELTKLSDDFLARSKYMSNGAQVAYEHRLFVIRHAIELLSEPVSESL